MEWCTCEPGSQLIVYDSLKESSREINMVILARVNALKGFIAYFVHSEVVMWHKGILQLKNKGTFRNSYEPSDSFNYRVIIELAWL